MLTMEIGHKLVHNGAVNTGTTFNNLYLYVNKLINEKLEPKEDDEVDEVDEVDEDEVDETTSDEVDEEDVEEPSLKSSNRIFVNPAGKSQDIVSQVLRENRKKSINNAHQPGDSDDTTYKSPSEADMIERRRMMKDDFEASKRLSRDNEEHYEQLNTIYEKKEYRNSKLSSKDKYTFDSDNEYLKNSKDEYDSDEVMSESKLHRLNKIIKDFNLGDALVDVKCKNFEQYKKRLFKLLQVFQKLQVVTNKLEFLRNHMRAKISQFEENHIMEE